MRLQLALDDITIEEAVRLVEQVQEYIDIIEIGTPMVIEYGMEAARRIKQGFPMLQITTDLKIMDAGYYEAAQGFKAGGDIATVMGFTHDETIKGAVQAAKEFSGKVMADMMCVNNLVERANDISKLGVEYICVHTAVDVQNNENPYEPLVLLKSELPDIKCCIAGGVNSNSVKAISEIKPEIIIVGSGITRAENPKAEAEKISKIIREQ